MKKLFSVITICCVMLFCATVFAMDAIQTQPSTDGNFEISVTRADIRDDVLTLHFVVRNTSTSKKTFECKYKEIYYTDIKNRKKYHVLRDSRKIYIAGPATSDVYGGFLKRAVPPGEQAILWVKFPAPAEDTETIDIYFPKAMPFEYVSLTRRGR